MKTAMFSILAAGKHIPNHRGPYKGVLRHHLGLIVPEPAADCRIRVGDEIRHWTEGGSLVFDDTYDHEVWNDTDGERVVLFLDVVRPLTGVAAHINTALLWLIAHSPLIADARRRQARWTAAVAARRGGGGRRGRQRPGSARVTNPPARAGAVPFLGARVLRRQLATLVLLVVLAGALLFAVPGLDPVLREIEGMSRGWVLVAAGLELASCLSFVVLFRMLFEIDDARDARELAWTSLGAGALLPAGGIGGLAIGAWALSLTGAATAWVVRRSTALFVLTSAVNVVTVVPAALLWSAQRDGRADALRASR